jgi:hypothetical protein
VSESFNWSSVAPLEDHFHVVALEEYHAGQTFPQIAEHLRGMGLAEDRIKHVLATLAQDRASVLFSAGKPHAEVVRALNCRGFAARHAETAAIEAGRSRSATNAAVSHDVWRMRSLVAGGILSLLGLVLALMEKVGDFPIPVAVYAAMIALGVVFLALGGVYIMFL